MGFARRSATIFAAFATVCAMALSLTACAPDATEQFASTKEQTTVTSDSVGTAALFTPSDGITLNQQTPLNKWAKLTPEINDALVTYGFKKKNISHTTSDSLDKQSRAIQDYVVNHLSGKDSSNDSDITIAPENMTLLVAPVVKADDSTRQYGDYVSQELSTENAVNEGSANASDDGNKSTDTEAGTGTADTDSSNSNDNAETDADQSQAVQRLVSSLKLAQESGMHVVLLANSIEGYKPDAFVQFSDARSIGHMQAEKLAAKLELDKASKDNPKRIEVLLPYTPTDANKNGSSVDSTFAEEAFQGIWQVLGAYYQKGTVVSPSESLDKSSSDKDWLNVAYDASEDNATTKELDRRLGRNGDASNPARIDGIIAMNDYVASEVVNELNDLGYTGSAADINPQITIAGIVGNITGKKDLQREQVPDPIKSTDDDANGTKDSDDADTKSDKAKDSQWPLVTGYGAYVSSIPSVVKGKQWMTGIENRQLLASDIAEVCGKLNTGEKITGLSAVRNTEVGGVKKVPTLSEPVLAVGASNLKATLIDPGYISLADAGL
ncbi:substrate-binding domain-containing protein [Bifidobacterium sp. LC6]|uniref:Substrate-binding domain-containing protein n=1 Tax=Bifidobacterium colobi TaxID=2809026 RepID=A0ABS5UZ10_9BIFI|nr:substrate-binding domain-containing protein [Bifidobacterium colobi]MBT1175423.1 substrate-binding domain-containing protein [Bifidobacterium colobi]